MLSAEKALSIQVHPSRAQARAGYAAENARGLAADDPARNYVDDWPKPELLYALTPFEVAAGLRTPSDAAALLRALEVDELAPLAAGLTGPVPILRRSRRRSIRGQSRGLRALSGPRSPRSWSGPTPARSSPRSRPPAARLAEAGGPYADACAAVLRVAADRPGDIGVVALLLMRYAVLQPGQAVFMPAGGLHAYLRGTGIELLANSDNVVRSGLTSKHVDVPELLKLLDPSVAVPVLSPRPLADGLATFDTPAPEFRLYLIDLPAPPSPRPRVRPARHRPPHPALPGRRLHPALRNRPGARPDPRRLLLHPLRRRPRPRDRPSPPSPSHPRRAHPRRTHPRAPTP